MNISFAAYLSTNTVSCVMCLTVHLHFQRREILTAKREPTDEECDWPSDEEDEEDKNEEGKLAVGLHFDFSNP